MDLQDFYLGQSFDAYEYFGAHFQDGGIMFRTYAPNAQKIAVIGQFNGWQEQPLEQIYQSGVWTCFTPDAKPGQMYKYVIYGHNAAEYRLGAFGQQDEKDNVQFGSQCSPSLCWNDVFLYSVINIWHNLK